MRPEIRADVLSSVKANLVHLLFVRYDRCPEVALKVLRRALELKLPVNLIDNVGVSPLHIAVRKKQYCAVRDAVAINQEHQAPIFDFNQHDKKGLTPLHVVIENQDHLMLLEVCKDPFIDPTIVDLESLMKPRLRCAIFSAFHKILYRLEKRAMQKKLIEAKCQELSRRTNKASVHFTYSTRAKQLTPVRGSQSQLVDFKLHEKLKRSKSPMMNTSRLQKQLHFASINENRTTVDRDFTIQHNLFNFKKLYTKVSYTSFTQAKAHTKQIDGRSRSLINLQGIPMTVPK